MSNNVYKIAIDTMGSDKGCAMVVEGALRAIRKNSDMGVVLVGKPDEIEAVLAGQEYDSDRLEVVAASEVITNYDNPVEAIFRKSDSSLVKALTLAADRDDIVGLINAGSTGALIAGSLRYLPSKDLKRPALAAVLPAERGGFTCLVDTGANIDCTPSQLLSFAKMGSEFMHDLYGIEDPRVGLLSNGAEATKGNKLVKETHALLAADGDINFVGNIEGTNALSGDCDVLVADGFSGNQVLKNSEGIAKRIITDIVKYSKKTGNPALMELVSYLMGVYDFNSLGGGILLGVRKPVIKAHGAANSTSIVSTSEMILNIAKNKAIFDGKDNR
jgi:glycerol-3-phosphate acyltransferase PlsX